MVVYSKKPPTYPGNRFVTSPHTEKKPIDPMKRPEILNQDKADDTVNLRHVLGAVFLLRNDYLAYHKTKNNNDDNLVYFFNEKSKYARDISIIKDHLSVQKNDCCSCMNVINTYRGQYCIIVDTNNTSTPRSKTGINNCGDNDTPAACMKIQAKIRKYYARVIRTIHPVKIHNTEYKTTYTKNIRKFRTEGIFDLKTHDDKNNEWMISAVLHTIDDTTKRLNILKLCLLGNTKNRKTDSQTSHDVVTISDVLETCNDTNFALSWDSDYTIRTYDNKSVKKFLGANTFSKVLSYAETTTHQKFGKRLAGLLRGIEVSQKRNESATDPAKNIAVDREGYVIIKRQKGKPEKRSIWKLLLMCQWFGLDTSNAVKSVVENQYLFFLPERFDIAENNDSSSPKKDKKKNKIEKVKKMVATPQYMTVVQNIKNDGEIYEVKPDWILSEGEKFDSWSEHVLYQPSITIDSNKKTQTKQSNTKSKKITYDALKLVCGFDKEENDDDEDLVGDVSVFLHSTYPQYVKFRQKRFPEGYEDVSVHIKTLMRTSDILVSKKSETDNPPTITAKDIAIEMCLFAYNRFGTCVVYGTTIDGTVKNILESHIIKNGTVDEEITKKITVLEKYQLESIEQTDLDPTIAEWVHGRRYKYMRYLVLYVDPNREEELFQFIKRDLATDNIIVPQEYTYDNTDRRQFIEWFMQSLDRNHIEISRAHTQSRSGTEKKNPPTMITKLKKLIDYKQPDVGDLWFFYEKIWKPVIDLLCTGKSNEVLGKLYERIRIACESYASTYPYEVKAIFHGRVPVGHFSSGSMKSLCEGLFDKWGTPGKKTTRMKDSSLLDYKIQERLARLASNHGGRRMFDGIDAPNPKDSSLIDAITSVVRNKKMEFVVHIISLCLHFRVVSLRKFMESTIVRA